MPNHKEIRPGVRPAIVDDKTVEVFSDYRVKMPNSMHRRVKLAALVDGRPNLTINDVIVEAIEEHLKRKYSKKFAELQGNITS